VHASNVREAEAQRLREEKKKKEKEAAAAAAAAAEAAANDDANAKPERVFLSIVSEPLGAGVEASWNGGKKHGNTPFNFDVPKNMKVHFDFSKEGFEPFSTEVIADTAQQVTAQLKAVVGAPVAEGEKGEAKKG
jgi:hypothetical protein